MGREQAVSSTVANIRYGACVPAALLLPSAQSGGSSPSWTLRADAFALGAVRQGIRPSSSAVQRGPFASATLAGALRWRADPLDRSIQRTFASIDRAGKGHITEADLRRYAAAHGLPGAYAAPFMDALRAGTASGSEDEGGGGSGSSTGDGREACRDGGGGGVVDASASGGGSGEVGYRRFRSFVMAREQGLREAFDMFDRDRDGAISTADLDLSLQHVSVCCPSTRCVLRCRQQVISQLVGRLDRDGSRDVSFDEFRAYFVLLPQNDASMIVEYWLGPSSSGSCADMGTRIAVQEGHRKKGSPWGHLFAGAVAGAVSRTATAPLETLRLAAMAGTLPAGGRIDVAAAALIKRHGWGALYKGNGVNVMRSAPQKALDFFAFDVYKGALSRGAGHVGLRQTFLAAGLAGATSCLLLYPLDVARMRMTLDTAGRYRGVVHCLTTIAATEGPRALVRGLGPSLAAIFPEAAITYGLHDLLKRGYKRAHRREPGIGASLAAGVASASMGQLVAYPLETISRRMQLGALPAAPAATAAAAGAGPAAASLALRAASAGGAGALQVAARLVREGGLRSLYAGVGAATARLIPMAVCSFAVYEGMRALLVQAEAALDRAVAEAQVQQLHATARAAGAAPALPVAALSTAPCGDGLGDGSAGYDTGRQLEAQQGPLRPRGQQDGRSRMHGAARSGGANSAAGVRTSFMGAQAGSVPALCRPCAIVHAGLGGGAAEVGSGALDPQCTVSVPSMVRTPTR